MPRCRYLQCRIRKQYTLVEVEPQNLGAETNGEEKPALAPRRRAALTPAKAV